MFSRETELVGCVYIQKEIYYKELAHLIRVWQVENVQGALAGWRPMRADASVLVQRPISWRPRKADVPVQVWSLSAGESSDTQRKVSPFALFMSSTGWVRLTCIIEGNLLYSKLILSRNTFTETPRKMFDQFSGHHGPGKPIHKINHCSFQEKC